MRFHGYRSGARRQWQVDKDVNIGAVERRQEGLDQGLHVAIGREITG